MYRIRASASGTHDPKAHDSRHLTGRPRAAFLLVSSASAEARFGLPRSEDR
jgi:hypothetical protein